MDNCFFAEALFIPGGHVDKAIKFDSKFFSNSQSNAFIWASDLSRKDLKEFINITDNKVGIQQYTF